MIYSNTKIDNRFPINGRCTKYCIFSSSKEATILIKFIWGIKRSTIWFNLSNDFHEWLKIRWQNKNELKTTFHADTFEQTEDQVKFAPKKTEVDFSLVLSVLTGRVCVSVYTFQLGAWSHVSDFYLNSW